MNVRGAARNAMRLQIAVLVTALSAIACKATPPGHLERAVMARVKHIAVGGKGDASPIPPIAENVARGRLDFSHYCVACHGLDGQNTGVPFAGAMSPPVPSLGAPEVQAYSDGQLHWIIANGIFPSGMPASRELLNDEEIWRIVLWLRHLPPAGSLGDPPAYVER